MASPLVSQLQGLTTCGPADRPWLFDRCRNSFLEMILPAAVGEARDLDPITEKGEEKKEREEEEEEGTGWGVVRREKEERDWEEKLRAPEGPGRPPVDICGRWLGRLALRLVGWAPAPPGGPSGGPVCPWVAGGWEPDVSKENF